MLTFALAFCVSPTKCVLIWDHLHNISPRGYIIPPHKVVPSASWSGWQGKVYPAYHWFSSKHSHSKELRSLNPIFFPARYLLCRSMGLSSQFGSNKCMELNILAESVLYTWLYNLPLFGPISEIKFSCIGAVTVLGFVTCLPLLLQLHWVQIQKNILFICIMTL